MKIEKIVTFLFILIIPFSSYGDIYAQSGYEEGRDGIILFTEKCPGVAGEAGFKVAVIKSNGNVLQGCYIKNNRGNFVAKWQDGRIVEMPSNIFKIKYNESKNNEEAFASTKTDLGDGRFAITILTKSKPLNKKLCLEFNRSRSYSVFVIVKNNEEYEAVSKDGCWVANEKGDIFVRLNEDTARTFHVSDFDVTNEDIVRPLTIFDLPENN